MTLELCIGGQTKQISINTTPKVRYENFYKLPNSNALLER